MKRILALLLAITVIAAFAACEKKENTATTTTVTGMIVSIDGTVISLWETDGNTMNFSGENMPSMPEGMENFPGAFPAEGFEGSFPEGMTPPQWDGENMPSDFPENGEFPGVGKFPGDGEFPEFPEDATFPEMGQFGDFGGMSGDFSEFVSDADTKSIDIGNAHISVEIDGGKATGSLEDLTPGSFVTITMDATGKVTNVLVSSRSGFNRGQRP